MSPTVEQQGALDIVRQFLDRYGLSELADWAWNEIVAGASPSKVQLDLYEQPAFKQRFPAIEARRKAGLPPISPDEYVNFEQQAGQMMRAAGFPPSFYDQHDDFTKFITADTSLAELSQRVQTYQKAAYDTPAEVRNQLKQLYGVDEGGLAAYFADPDRALPLLQQRFNAADIAGQAQRQGFGGLGVGEAERLAKIGVTSDQAATGFGQVVQARELFQQLPGESPGAPDRAAALGLVAGDARAQQAVDTQSRRRKAQFGSGGSFAGSQTGTSGLGQANT